MFGSRSPGRFFDWGPEAVNPAALSAREREILQLAAHDFSGPDIAAFLRISRATVRTHFANIYIKLGVRSRAGAVAEGLRMHFIS